MQINENSGQETENQPTSSDVEDCRGIKRKWPTLQMTVGLLNLDNTL